MRNRKHTSKPARRGSAASRLEEAESLYRDFLELTPTPFVPLAKAFTSFAEYERWKRDEAPPWYR